MLTAHRIVDKFRSIAFENPFVERAVRKLFFTQLIKKTGNFSGLTWLGQPVWQNVLDLWVIQETICEVKPELLIECGTNRAGSAFFYAKLFDLLGQGRIITIDVEKLHEVTHPRIEFIVKSSVDEAVVAHVKSAVAATKGPVMVILDSDHSEAHVSRELECYAGFVTPGSYLQVQDGVIDELSMLRSNRPGPLPAIRKFLTQHPEFEVDSARNERFLITHHPLGWLKRKP